MPRTKTTSRTRTTRSSKQELIADSGSYTNLIYGIITVGIIFSLILITLKVITPKHNSGAITDQAAKTSITDEKNIAQSMTPTPTGTSNVAVVSGTPTPTQLPITPTSIPTKIPNTPTTVVTPSAPTPSKEQPKGQNTPKEYTVQDGESLWSISEKLYKSGYNWVSLAKANNISNPGVIYKGTKLTVPSVTPIVIAEKTTPQATSQVQNPQNGNKTAVTNVNKISGATYTIQHGDDLWDIAVRAYGDGYKWTEIARVNNILNPNIIHSGNTLKLPRS